MVLFVLSLCRFDIFAGVGAFVIIMTESDLFFFLSKKTPVFSKIDPGLKSVLMSFLKK